MIQTFRDGDTEALFSGENTKRVRKAIQRDLWKVMLRKLDMLHAATKVEDLAAFPGNRLEHLKGNRAGFYSIRVNDQYRVTFRFEKGAALDVAIEDYH